jgi:LPS-assembly protein
MRNFMQAALAGTALGAIAFAAPAAAQLGGLARSATTDPLSKDQPVTFTADQVEYDRNNAIVSASGHVEAWQGDHVLRADHVTFDRNTDVAAATGNVVLVEPDGQVLFADYAELTQGMREGVLRGMRALLAENGRLAANGARRTEGKVNELTHAVYTTCNVCATDPSKPPLWQLRAISALQDTENQRIEYQDVALDFLGVPIAYFPYFAHADPSVRRASGLLVPFYGSNTHLGATFGVPYYYAIDDQQDVTVTPLISSSQGGEIGVDYRRRFNNGAVRLNGALGLDNNDPQAYISAKGNFSYDDTYRYGFDINRASSVNYVRDYRFPDYADVLASSAFVEGFGVGSYTKLDALAYQSLATSINQTYLPYVLPRYQYSFFGEPDALGGRLTFTTENFNVIRGIGTNTQRASFSSNWQRPFTGQLGELYKITLRTDAASYNATSLNQQPNFATTGNATTVRAQPTLAGEMRWPFLRDGGASGTQIIEPIVQLVGGPNTGRGRRSNIPNEDSLDFEFTDANLFSLNRFPGIDRQEGGLRANAGLHGTWTAGGAMFDGLVGQSYREHKDQSFLPLSGLNRNVSDIVARGTISPNGYFDLTARTRYDPFKNAIRFGDALASAGAPILRVSAGYLYSATNPYTLYDPFFVSNGVQARLVNLNSGQGLPPGYFTPRNEVTLNASTQSGPYKLSGFARRDLSLGKLVSIGAHAAYENECLIFDVNLYKRYVTINNDTGATTVLFQITLKTIGQFGYHAS